MVSPFLLREVLDEAIPEKDHDLLIGLVGGMIAIASPPACSASARPGSPTWSASG